MTMTAQTEQPRPATAKSAAAAAAGARPGASVGSPAANPALSPAANPAAWAKGALRRLAQAQQEPTPENYARAYAEESGLPVASATAATPAAKAAAVAAPAADGSDWAVVLDRVVRHLDRPGQQWTPARRKDSLQRVMAGSRSDSTRMLQRLQGLTAAWESDQPADTLELGLTADRVIASAASAVPAATAASISTAAATPATATEAAIARPPAPAQAAPSAWPDAAVALHHTVQAALPASDPRAALLATELADALAALAAAMGQGLDKNNSDNSQSAAALASHLPHLQQLCVRAQSLFAHRQHLVDELSALCRELAAGLTDLVEDDTWARGQCESLQARLNPSGDAQQGASPSVRNVRAATELLAETRSRQQQVRQERRAAQTTLKTLIQRMIGQAGELGDQAGRYQQSLGQHAQAIASADSLQSLAGVVQAMLDDNKAVQRAVGATRVQLHDDHAQAQMLQARVVDLEAQLRRLSDEAATDALTQVANRRGLGQAFEALVAPGTQHISTGSSADASAAPAPLAIGLLDIDNFKKLNDTLGHAAGDQALKALAAAVRERLRPVDHIARFGGEEFVVLLPHTPLAEAQQALTRLQRSLSAGLFMHEGKDVLVTFSAGVTSWRTGETLESALERADEALYEAKRTGKNRTCVG